MRSKEKYKNKAIEILIVEDSPTQAMKLKKLLERDGYDTRVAANGQEALEAVRTQKPALIIADIIMPVMDGYEMCRAIKFDKALKDIPVILLTTLSHPEDIIQGLDVRADYYVTKPYKDKFLLSKIKDLLATPSQPKSERRGKGLEVTFAGKRHTVTSNRQQMLNLLFSTYENAVLQNKELIKAKRALEGLNKELEKNLHELQVSEERFRSLVMTIPDIIYRIDTAGKFIFLNDAVQKLGYDSEELIGRYFSEIILPADVDAVSRSKVLPKYKGKVTGDKNAPKLFDERRTGKRKTTGLEIRLAIKSSKGFKPGLIEPIGKGMIVVEVNSSGMYEINPNTKEKILIGTVGVVRDISERKRTEKALHDAQEELVRKGKLAVLGQLAGGVGHELRNPLGVISNAVYYLKTTLPDADETTREYLELITLEVKNSEKIVSDLLGISRTRPAEREKIVLSELVAQVLEKQPSPEGVKVVTEIAPDLPHVFIDPRQIGQVLYNLITNAFQAMTSSSSVEMPEGGKLILRAQAEDGKVSLSIIDTGSGISKENMKKLFEPLFTTRARGIGLGLAVSKSLVEVNGGSIEVESEIGKGSTFTVRLPIEY